MHIVFCLPGMKDDIEQDEAGYHKEENHDMEL